MKILKITVPALALLALLVAWLAPIGPMPGFFIGGSAAETPAAWGDTSQVDEIRLEVPGGIPRVVIVWVIQLDGDLHVVGSSDGGWVNKLGEGGAVRMRMNGNTYSLNASRVTGGWEPILEAYVNKYRPNYPDIVAGFPTLEEAAGTMAVFRLSR
jgi:hypothetical protein